jgi:hypothetical protein
MPEEDAAPSGKVAIADLPRIRSERFMSVYANHTEAAPGFFDIALVFCHIGRGRVGKLAIEEDVEVVLSWEHTIRLRNLLDRMVEAYEAQQGKIRIMNEEPNPAAEVPNL